MAVTDARFPNGTPLFGCASCCRDFASLAAFDQHSPGRCVDVADEPGWLQDKRGRWTTEKLAVQAKGMRAHFAQPGLEAATDAQDATEAAA
jgi:hypothetical protein